MAKLSKEIVNDGQRSYLSHTFESVDGNVAASTDYLDTRGLGGISGQLSAVSGTIATVSVVVEGANNPDAATWSTIFTLNTGAKFDFDDNPYRYVRVRIATPEGGASVLDVDLHMISSGF